MVSGDFLLGVSDVGSSPITSELATALNPAAKKMSKGTTFPSMWCVIPYTVESMDSRSTRHGSKRPDRKRRYALSGNSYVILKEKGYEEYKSKR